MESKCSTSHAECIAALWRSSLNTFEWFASVTSEARSGLPMILTRYFANLITLALVSEWRPATSRKCRSGQRFSSLLRAFLNTTTSDPSQMMLCLVMSQSIEAVVAICNENSEVAFFAPRGLSHLPLGHPNITSSDFVQILSTNASRSKEAILAISNGGTKIAFSGSRGLSHFPLGLLNTTTSNHI